MGGGFGSGSVGWFRIFEGQLIYLIMISITSSWGSLIRRNGRASTCFKEGNFTVTEDCRTFVTCLPGDNFLGDTSQCSMGYNFDALERRCLLSEDVDCSRHYSPHSMEPGNRLRKRDIRAQNSVQIRNRRYATVRTRPWGVWDDAGVYIPYLGLLSLELCPAKVTSSIPAVVEVTSEKPSSTTTTTTETSTSEYEEEIITDVEEPVKHVVHNYGHTVGQYRKENILKKRVHFLSEDLDGGAVEEIKVGRFVMGADANLIWTQKANAHFTVSRVEDVESKTEAAPWSYTKVSKI